jgi:hypothetical protein
MSVEALFMVGDGASAGVGVDIEVGAGPGVQPADKANNKTIAIKTANFFIFLLPR